MKTLIPSLLLLAPIGAFAADDAGVGLGFEVGTSYYIPSQKPNNKAMGNFFAVNLNLSSVEVGYYFEALNLKMKADDDNDGAETRAEVDINVNAIRVIKPIIKEVGIGLAVGMADIQGVTTGDNAGVRFSQLAPMADIFARVTPISGGDKVKAAVNVILGYRFIIVDSFQADGGADYVDLVDNFNGFRVGLSVGINF